MRQLHKIILSCLLICLVSADVLAEDIVIYSSDAFPPQVYLSDDHPAGFVPALFQKLSASTGDTYRFVLLPWKRAISESAAGHGGIVNFSMTASRQRDFDFSIPLYKNEVELTVLTERLAEFKSVQDLKGKTFGLPLGASFGGAFEKGVNDHTYLLDEDSQPTSRVNKLLAGRIDVAVLGQSYMKFSAQSDSYLRANQNRLAILPFTLIDDWEYLAFAKSMHMKAALQRFNTALLAFRKTDDYQKLVKQHLSK